MGDILAVANEWGVWLTAAPIVIVTLLQVVIYYRQLFVAAPVVDITRDQLRQAFRTGVITAIGPVLAIFIVMVGLMSVIGAPMAWMRLAIVGAAPTELTAATVGSQAAGVTFGGPDYTLETMAVSWWTMAINGIGWLIPVGLFAHTLEGIREKVGGGDQVWLALLSNAAMLGVFGYLNSGNIIALGGPFVAAVVGAISMVVIIQITKKVLWLREYSLGIAMIIGMLAAVLFG
jgi:hypothetical protein